MLSIRSFVIPAASVLIPVLLFAAYGRVQNQQGPIKLEADLVTIDATVVDQHGNFIRDLTAADFTVYQDGVRQPVEFFEASESADLTRPLALVFALDTSGSIEPEEVTKQRVAAESFMRLVRPESLFAVISFNNEIRVLQSLTSDPAKISRAFSRVSAPGGSTRLFEAIDRGVSMLKRAPRFRKGRRLRPVVIVISDGIDSVARVDQRELIERANDAGVTVYSITLPTYGPALGRGQRGMTLLDASLIVPGTGGADFSADQKDFTPVFRAIAEEIRSSYTLAYYPPESSRRDGRTHQIRIEVTRSGAIVRASRTTYQAPRK